MTSRKRNWLLALLTAALCTACSRAPRTTVEAGPFDILRTLHTYGNWNTGGTTSYYRYQVRYRKDAFRFPGFPYPGNAGTFESRQIARAYVVSQAPAALLVLAGDPNNDASWNLLVDTPTGLQARHIARYGSPGQLAWLDGDEPQVIADARDLLRLEAGRWLWIDNQALLDRSALRIHQLQSPVNSRDEAGFVMFSPDRRRMARFTTRADPQDFRNWHPVILINDIANGSVTYFDIDQDIMWFDDSRDIDRHWIQTYFEWRDADGNGFTLHPRPTPLARPYHGRLSIEEYSKGVQYHVPRLRFAQRKAAMDLIATSLGTTYVMPDPEPIAPPPPAAAATTETDDREPRDAAMSAPPVSDPLVRADLAIAGRTLAIYFSDSGLSIENREPALNDAVKKIAALLDAQLALPAGQPLIAPSTVSIDAAPTGN